MRSLILSTILLVACIEDPPSSGPITLIPDPTSVVADGTSLVTISVSANTDSDVTLTASSGSFVTAPTPATGALPTTTVKTGRGTTKVSYRAGLDAGTAVIIATSGAFSTTLDLPLTAVGPTHLSLTSDRTTVTGDGVSFVELDTEALTDSQARVSRGTIVQFAVCCLNPSNEVQACFAGEAPLIAPKLGEIDDGHSVSVRAVTLKVTTPKTAVLRARYSSTIPTSAPCGNGATSEISSDDVLITVTP